VNPNAVELTVGRAVSFGAAGTAYPGLSSNFLRDRLVGGSDRVSLFVKPSAFRLPSDPQAPIVMIGGGTGIAPFRSFWQQRQNGSGKNVLFFGCNHREKDFLYREEIESLVKRGRLELFPAFSHDQEERIYVQNVMAQQAQTLWNLIDKEAASVYICG
jgi:sulfite reductase alpha subunit-like flavoprotein